MLNAARNDMIKHNSSIMHKVTTKRHPEEWDEFDTNNLLLPTNCSYKQFQKDADQLSALTDEPVPCHVC